MKRALAAMALGVLTVAGCGTSGTPTPTPTPDAIDMMMVAFEDYPRRTEIEAALLPAMNAVGLANTEENQQKAASALVALRKQNGTREIDILRCMPSRASDTRIAEQGYPYNFASVAAVCSVDIAQGRYMPN